MKYYISETDLNTLKLYKNKISEYPILDYQEEHQLLISAHKGDIEAFNKLNLCNLRLVLYISKKFINQGP